MPVPGVCFAAVPGVGRRPKLLSQGPGVWRGTGMPSCRDIWPTRPVPPTSSELPNCLPWDRPAMLESHPNWPHACPVPASFLVRRLMSLGVAWSSWSGARRPGRGEGPLCQRSLRGPELWRQERELSARRREPEGCPQTECQRLQRGSANHSQVPSVSSCVCKKHTFILVRV